MNSISLIHSIIAFNYILCRIEMYIYSNLSGANDKLRYNKEETINFHLLKLIYQIFIKGNYFLIILKAKNN